MDANAALNCAAWTLGCWVAAGALDLGDVEDKLHARGSAERAGRRWRSPVLGDIRSGLRAGLQEPMDLQRVW